MSKKTLPIYRLPVASTTQIGQVRIVIDRNQQAYVDGSKVLSANPSGPFLILTLANQQVYYVKADEYQQVLAADARRRSRS